MGRFMKWQVTVVLCGVIGVGAAGSAQEQAHEDLRAYVQSDSFPQSYRQVSEALDSSATPELVAMLGSSALKATDWRRAAGVLGVVGDERAVEPLIEFVSRPEPQQPMPQTHDDARMAALMALGGIVNRTGDERALNYLIDSLTPRVWRQRKIDGLPSRASSYAEYDLELSKYAVFGLALSGNARAGEALELLDESPAPEQVQFRRSLGTTLPQWLEVHRLVAERGIAGMYEYYESRRQLEAEQKTEEARRLREGR